MNYFFSEEELGFNQSLDAWDLLLKMGFNENSLYREGNTIRLFCPLHKDQIRRSMIVYTDKNTFKCQYTNCEGHKGGNMLEFYSAYMGVDLPEVLGRIKNQGGSDTDLVDRADKMIQEGSLVDALPLLQKAVHLDPANEITRCRLAALYLELGDKEAGYQEYMTAAEHFGVRGELDKTLNIYNILVIISPDDVKVRKQLSYLFSRLKREDEAVSQLKWVVDKHIRKGELADAVGMCKKMIELCPEYPGSHRILGEIFLKQGNYFDAIEELRTAATHFVRENNLKKARETVDLGLKYTPGNTALKDLRGKIEKAIEMKAQLKDTRDEAEQEYEAWLHELKQTMGVADAGGGGAVPRPTPGAGGPAQVRTIPGIGTGSSQTLPRLTPKSTRPGSTPLTRPPGAGTAGSPSSGALPKVGTITAPRPGVTRPAGTPFQAKPQSEASSLPSIAKDDPRIELFKSSLQDRTADELESLHSHLVKMFDDVQRGTREGFLSEFEANVVREFYAAFCLALDAFRPATGQPK